MRNKWVLYLGSLRGLKGIIVVQYRIVIIIWNSESIGEYQYYPRDGYLI